MKRLRFRIKTAALLVALMLILAGVYGVRSVSHYGSRWFSYVSNPRLAALKSTVREGSIRDRNGILLAETREDGTRAFAESTPIRSALVHLIGDRNGKIANSVESFQAGYLLGYSSSLRDAIHHLINPSDVRQGNNLTLTVDAELCAAIPGWFEAHPITAGKSGAAVVLNYRTGEVLALISLPCFDPDTLSEADAASLDHPYLNRATQVLYPPGSIFSIVTAAAALSRLPDARSQVFLCNGEYRVSENFSVHDFNLASHGSQNLRQAFARSCNPFFAKLALDVGEAELRSVAERFGFNRNFLFQDLIVANSFYPTGIRSKEDLAATGVGQGTLTVTPLHLCLIASGIANGGIMPEPRLLLQVDAVSGSRVLSFSSAPVDTVCDRESAAEISVMMQDAVQNGVGSAAAVSTLDIRGQTGIAQSDPTGKGSIHYGWFAGFNAQQDLPVAVCVLVEDIPEGESGENTAAVIAGEIFTYLRNHPDLALPGGRN